MAKYTKQITLGYDRSGNRVRKRVYANTKAELENIIYNAKRDFESSNDYSEMTLNEYASIWLDVYKKNTSPRTYAMYSSLIKKFGSIGEYPISNIKRTDLQLLINELSDRPQLCGKVLMCIKQIYKSAVIDDAVIKNPTEGLKAPKIIPKEKRALSKKEKDALNIANFSQKEKMFVDMLLHFGLRPGEALALTKSSFDLNERTLTIDKAITYVENEPILKGTKTNVNRVLPIPGSMIEEISEYFGACGEILFRGDLTEEERFMSKMSYRILKKNIFEKINKALGGSEVENKLNGMTLYTFRHNKATALYYVDGISIKAKAAYMGHSVEMLLQTYSHIDQDKEQLAKFDAV